MSKNNPFRTLILIGCIFIAFRMGIAGLNALYRMSHPDSVTVVSAKVHAVDEVSTLTLTFKDGSVFETHFSGAIPTPGNVKTYYLTEQFFAQLKKANGEIIHATKGKMLVTYFDEKYELTVDQIPLILARFTLG